MKKTFRTTLLLAPLLFAVSVFASTLALSPSVSAAKEASSGGSTSPSCGDLKTSIINCDGDGGNPVVNLLLEIINFLAVGVGIAVVGGIVWGGMLYASSNGDSSKAKQGITAIVNSVIGLLLFMFTYALINFLVPGGLFN